MSVASFKLKLRLKDGNKAGGTRTVPEIFVQTSIQSVEQCKNELSFTFDFIYLDQHINHVIGVLVLVKGFLEIVQRETMYMSGKDTE